MYIIPTDTAYMYQGRILEDPTMMYSHIMEQYLKWLDNFNHDKNGEVWVSHLEFCIKLFKKDIAYESSDFRGGIYDHLNKWAWRYRYCTPLVEIFENKDLNKVCHPNTLVKVIGQHKLIPFKKEFNTKNLSSCQKLEFIRTVGAVFPVDLKVLDKTSIPRSVRSRKMRLTTIAGNWMLIPKEGSLLLEHFQNILFNKIKWNIEKSPTEWLFPKFEKLLKQHGCKAKLNRVWYPEPRVYQNPKKYLELESSNFYYTLDYDLLLFNKHIFRSVRMRIRTYDILRLIDLYETNRSKKTFHVRLSTVFMSSLSNSVIHPRSITLSRNYNKLLKLIK